MRKEYKPETCHDCGAKEGELHSRGCDMERCPYCGYQLITCRHRSRSIPDEERVPYIHYPNLCCYCGELYPKMFSVPDAEWEKYIEQEMRGKMLCPACYDWIKRLIDEGRGGHNGSRAQ